jgi:hypothetical protein
MPIEQASATPDEIAELPLPERGLLRRVWARVTAADRAAAVLLAAHLLLVLWVSALGGPYRDDIRLQSMAVEEDLVWWAFRSPESHFAPIPRFIIGAQAYAAPWDVGVAAATTVLLFMAQGALMWLLLRELLGPHRSTLGVFIVYLVSPILVPSMGWWTQAVTLTPATVGMLGSLWCLCRYWRSRGWPDLIGTWSFYAFGLLSWEKALLTLPAAVALSVLFLASDELLAMRVRSVLARSRLWLGMLVLTGAHLVYYVTGPFDRGGDAAPLTPWLVIQYLWLNATQALLPGMTGGPWRWDSETSPYFGIANPPVPMIIVGLGVVVAVLAVAFRRSPSRTWRALLLVALVWLPSAAMLLLGRVTKFGLAPASDYRYLPEVAAITVVALGLALNPMRGRPTPRSTVGSRVLTAVLLLVVVGSAISTTRWAAAWHENPARAYAANVIRSFDEQREPFRMFDTDLPSEVLDSLFGPYTQVSRAFAPFLRSRSVSFDSADPPAVVVDRQGTLVPGRLQPVAVGQAGPEQNCGYVLNPGRRVITVPLDTRVPELPNMFLRLGGLAGAPVRLQITVNSTEGRAVVSPSEGLTVPEGLAGVLLRLPRAPVGSITFTYLSSVSGVCLDKVTVGVSVRESS